MKKIDKVIVRIASTFGALAYIGIIVMCLLNLSDVVLTKVASAPIKGCYELTEVILMCTIFSALAYGQTCKAHVNTTLFITHLPRAAKLFVFGVMDILATGACAFWTYAAYTQIHESIRTNTITSLLKIPMYPFYIFAVVLLVIFCITLLWDTIKVFAAIKNDWAYEDITSNWA